MDDELLNEFISESREHLATIEADLLTIEESGADIDEELVNKVFRAAHSIKGGSGFFGLERVKELAHRAETVLDMLRSRKMAPNAEIVNVLLAAEATVFTASNGIEALDIFRRESPTMVLTDLSMPERDGWQLLQDIRSSENGTRTPVLALTAHAMVGDKDRVMEAGFNGYLSKPLRMVTLLADLRACLENNSNEVDANKE